MKKILTTVTALLFAVAMTACGADEAPEVSITEGTTAATTAADTAAETTTKAETVTVTETTTAAEETSGTEAENLFQGTGYTISVDSAVWEDYTAYLAELSQYADEVDVGVEINPEDIQNMGDAMFYRTGSGGANFNVVVNEVGDPGDDFDIGTLEPLMEEQFAQVTGYTYLGGQVVDVNGYSALKMDVEADYGGGLPIMKTTQYMFIEGTAQYGITYTANTDEYDTYLPDFETVVRSIKFEQE